MLNFSYWSEFVFAWGFRSLFLWSSCLSLRGRVSFVVFCGCHVSLCVVLESNLFIVFVVVTFVFAWLRSQMDVVSWLPKPILVFLESGTALLEGGAARGWRWLLTWIDEPQIIC